MSLPLHRVRQLAETDGVKQRSEPVKGHHAARRATSLQRCEMTQTFSPKTLSLLRIIACAGGGDWSVGAAVARARSGSSADAPSRGAMGGDDEVGQSPAFSQSPQKSTEIDFAL